MDEIDSITEDELIAALFSAQTTSEVAKGVLTTRELAREVGHGVYWVREQLRSLIDAGRVEPVRVQIVDIAGRVTTAPAYKLVDDDKSSRTDI